MKSAKAAQPQIGGPQAPGDVKHDGVGHFLESTTRGKCKVCQKNTCIMSIKCNLSLHRSNAAICGGKCAMNLNKLIARTVLYETKQL